MKRFILLSVMLGSELAAAAAAAQTTTIWRSGPIGRWSVTAASGTGGNVFCYMSNLAGGSGMGYAVFKSGRMRIVLMHREWNIPPHAQARISMRIEGFSPWSMNAKRSDDSARSVIVDARFDDAAVRFLNQIRAGDWLVISFPNGQSYRVSLHGSNAAVQQLYYCNKRFVLGETGTNPLED